MIFLSLFLATDSSVSEIVVEWTSLETGRNYNIDEMKTFFGETSEQVNGSSHLHT